MVITNNPFIKIISLGIELLLARLKLTYTRSKSPLKPEPAASPSKRLYAPNYKYRTHDEILALFKHLNLTYIGRTQFSAECKMLENIDQAAYLPYKEHKASHDNHSFTFTTDILAEKIAPIYLKWINDKVGYGCFADEDIPPNTLIGEYTGEIQLKEEANQSNQVWNWNYPSHGKFSEQYLQSMSLSAFKIGNEIRFINHSDAPNCKSVFVFTDGAWCVIYVANKLIKKNEEILVSYGKAYWYKKRKIHL